MALKFVYVCDLFESIESLEKLHVRLSKHDRQEKRRHLTKQWFDNHKPSIGTSTADLSALLSCLLPARRPDRVYCMRKKRISCCLGFALGLPNEHLMRLEASADGAELADVAASIVADRATGALPTVSVCEVDSTFNHLASMSRASSATVRRGRDYERTTDQRHVLKPLLLKLTARELRWFLRLAFKQLGLAELHESSIFYHIHPLLLTVMRLQSDFGVALETLGDPSLQRLDRRELSEIPKHLLHGVLMPKIGAKIGRPHFFKVRSIKDCMRLVGDSTWNVEPKFDGEYCQIHVDLSREHDRIRIFSKSGKESTYDRTKLHPFLRDSLRLNDVPRFKRRCILEGEMVVFDTRDMSILPFHTIRKHVSRSGFKPGTEQDSEIQPHEQLGIVYYDVMLVDDDPVMHLPHTIRRERLTNLIKKIDGHAITADWGTIRFKKYSSRAREAEARLESVFQRCMAKRCEGLILKPTTSPYLPLLLRNFDTQPHAFLKMKADYIPGLGDTADFVVIGGLKRTIVNVRADLIHKVKWTHLVLACLLNKDAVLQDGAKPLYKTMAVVDRPAISQDDLLHISAAADPLSADVRDQGQSMLVTNDFHITIGSAQTRPETLFRRPFVVEVVGSAFERPASTRTWMLRHSRIVKIHGDDRTLEDVVSFDELQTMANEWLKVPGDQLQEELRWQQRLRDVTRPTKEHKHLTQSSEVTEITNSANTTPVKPSSLIPETPASGSSTASRALHASASLIPSSGRSGIAVSLKTSEDLSSLSPTPVRTRASHTPTLVRVDSMDLGQIGRRYVSSMPELPSGRKRSQTSASDITPPRKRVTSGQMEDSRRYPISYSPAANSEQTDPVPAPDELNTLTEMDVNVTGAAHRYQNAGKHSKVRRGLQTSSSRASTPLETLIQAGNHHDTPNSGLLAALQRHAPRQIPSALRHTSPFRRDGMSIYRPVSMACTLLDKYLLPLFASNKPIITNLQTWARFSSTNGASPNTLLVVFVDKCCSDETQAALDELVRTRFGKCIDVQVWDYRILTLLCECDADDRTELTAAQLAILLTHYLVASLLSRPVTQDTPSQGSHLPFALGGIAQAHAGPVPYPTAANEHLHHAGRLEENGEVSVVTRRQNFDRNIGDLPETGRPMTNMLVTGGWHDRQQCTALADLWING